MSEFKKSMVMPIETFRSMSDFVQAVASTNNDCAIIINQTMDFMSIKVGSNKGNTAELVIKRST